MLVIAGCGSQHAATTPASTPTTTSASVPPKADAPAGKLSPAEYASIRAAFKLVAPLDGAQNVRKVLRIGNRACTKVATDTELLAAVRADCIQTMRFYAKAGAMITRKAECTRAAQAGDVSCFADLFRSLGRSVRVAAVRSAAVNAALRKRAIRGACAAAIGTDRKKLAAARQAQRDGIRAAHALEAKNRDALQRAANALQADLNAMDAAGISGRQALRQLKACV